MSLTAGTRLGPYEIVSPLGAGGMGEVYRARDTKLGRDVAIKVVSEAFAYDPERVARFEREAHLLASLNHPHIATVYGLEHSPSTGSGHAATPCLVMELVEGDTLAERLQAGPLPMNAALAIARQIADALYAAHERGIVHRDLKPANIALTGDDQVKVLDFGLAKMLDSGSAGSTAQDPAYAAANSPTMTLAATRAGVILGTAAYMAPEQAKGKAADKRSDIWAFGCILFEMLTGRRAFDGEDASETLAAVLRGEPEWAALPQAVPRAATVLLRRCLEKNRTDRAVDAAAAAFVLRELDNLRPETSSPVRTRAISRRAALALSVGLLTGVALIAAVVRFGAPRGAAQVTRLTIALPAGDVIANVENPVVAISADGSLVAYMARRDAVEQLFLRAIDNPEPQLLAGTEGATNPFFSPDGAWLAFFARGKLWKLSVASGATEMIAEAPAPRGGAWGADDTIYFAPSTAGEGLSRVTASGGRATSVTTLNREAGEVSHRWPQVLPGGKALLFSVWTGPGRDERRIDVQILATGERRTIVAGAESGRYVESGHVVYARADVLMALPFDLDALRPLGTAVRAAEVVWTGGEGAQFAVSDRGDLVYLGGDPARTDARLVWVDRGGRVEPLSLPVGNISSPALSPDGRRVALNLNAGSIDIAIADVMRATILPLRAGTGSSQAATWTPDGKRVAYRATRTGFRNIFWRAVDGTAAEERLTTSGNLQTPSSWSPDGRRLLYSEVDPVTSSDIWVLSLDGGGKAEVIVRTPFRETNAVWSPDGRWIAYVTNESGQSEVMVQPYPLTGEKWPVSSGGGREPVWDPNGRELFYRNGNQLLSVDVRLQPAFRVGTPRVLFDARFFTSPNDVTGYSISADGQRFLFAQPVRPEPPVNQLQIVQHWFEELTRLAPVQ